MAHSIKTVYVVHHSHTDIGYTDLQERVIAIQVNYIKTVLSMMRQPEYADFRWNCETLYCVEEFWKQASEEDRADFARFVKEGKIGISANYLNFNDLVNADVFGKRLAKWQDKLQPFGTKIHTAMAADVNGFSMGYRDAMIENGVEFFFTNVHCHHGMYPLYQNQNAFFWENASGQRLLVWNGEHYNLGNVLGLQPNHAVNWMMRNRLGEDADAGTFFSDQLHTNLDKYLTECETEGYPYDFIVTAFKKQVKAIRYTSANLSEKEQFMQNFGSLLQNLYDSCRNCEFYNVKFMTIFPYQNRRPQNRTVCLPI